MLDFHEEVIEKSHEIPVLVDFWAPWCGPCRMLGPIIEQLAEEQKDRWALVKVNTEIEVELSQEYKIRGIPNVKLFVNGKVVNEFSGALPKFQIEQWLNENIPDPAEQDFEDILSQKDNMSSNEYENVVRDFLSTNPTHKQAQLALARSLVYTDPDEAIELLRDIHLGQPRYDAASDIRTLAELMQWESESDMPVSDALSRARNLLKDNEEEAIKAIIEAVTIDKGYHDDLPRRTAIALFRIWGNDYPLTKKYRWQFDMQLY